MQTRPQPSPPLPPPPPPEKESHWWQDPNLIDLGLHIKIEDIRSVANAMRDAGKGIAGAWEDIRKHIDRVFKLPIVSEHISEGTKKTISEVVTTGMKVAGFATAGVAGVAGIVKLTDKKDKVRRVEGAGDVVTAGVIASTVGGLSGVAAVLAPLGFTLGMAKGGLKFAKAFKEGDGRLEVQGALDATRGLGGLASRAGHWSGLLATAGMLMGVAAGGIQLVRGAIDLNRGLDTNNKAKQLEGLTDVGMAVGMMLTATGVGTVPGIVLTVASGAVRVLYAVSKKFRKRTDGFLDKHQGHLNKVANGVEFVVKPVIHVGRKIIELVTGWNHGGSS